MPTTKMFFAPGFNAEATPSLTERGYESGNLVRFMPSPLGPTSGILQKLGGWAKYYPNPMGSPVNNLHAWEDIDAGLHLGIGCMNSLNVLTGSMLVDITPQSTTTNPAVNFSTTSGSATVTVVDSSSNVGPFDVAVINTQIAVGGLILFGAYAATNSSSTSYTIQAGAQATGNVNNGGAVAQYTSTNGSTSIQVTLAAHGFSPGNTYSVLLPTTFAGVTISGFYNVNTVTSSSTFTISVANAATANLTVSQNGGNANITYWRVPLPTGPGLGYGQGGYGLNGYGGTGGQGGVSGTPITTSVYSLDNWASLLVASPKNGPIFVWDPTQPKPVAQMVANAPISNAGCFVAMPAQIIVAWGSSDQSNVQDPLLLSWSTAGDYTTWTPTATDQAGDFRLPRGSKIVGALQGPQYAVVWTDIEVWSMSYIGFPLVWSFNSLGQGCGMVAQFASCVMGGTVYWMSQKQFFMLPSGGSVTPLPCSVWDWIFQQIDTTNYASIRCCPNSQFSEISWHFPTVGSNGVNTAYVKYNALLNCWDYGYDNPPLRIGRSAWIDQSVLGSPIGAGAATNYIYQHEISNDADGAAMTPTASTGWFALSDGEDFMTVDALYPDMKFGMTGQPQTANVNASFQYAPYPQSPEYTTQSYLMQDQSVGGTPFYRPMVRGRLMSMTVSSNDIGSFWRIGGLRVRMAPDGQLG
jgi:hypothetical protein